MTPKQKAKAFEIGMGLYPGMEITDEGFEQFLELDENIVEVDYESKRDNSVKSKDSNSQ